MMHLELHRCTAGELRRQADHARLVAAARAGRGDRHRYGRSGAA